MIYSNSYFPTEKGVLHSSLACFHRVIWAGPRLARLLTFKRRPSGPSGLESRTLSSPIVRKGFVSDEFQIRHRLHEWQRSLQYYTHSTHNSFTPSAKLSTSLTLTDALLTGPDGRSLISILKSHCNGLPNVNTFFISIAY